MTDKEENDNANAFLAEDVLEDIKEACDEILDMLESFNYPDALVRIGTLKVQLESIETAIQAEVSTDFNEE